jgi:hypothetical protein
MDTAENGGRQKTLTDRLGPNQFDHAAKHGMELPGFHGHDNSSIPRIGGEKCPERKEIKAFVVDTSS